MISHGVESRCLRVMLDYLKRKVRHGILKEKYAYRLTALWQSDFVFRHADQVVLSTTEDRDYLARSLGIRRPG